MKLIDFLLKYKILQKCESGQQWPGYFSIWVYMEGEELYIQFLLWPFALIARTLYALLLLPFYDLEMRMAYLGGGLHQLEEEEKRLIKVVVDHTKLVHSQIRVEQLEKALQDVRATLMNLSSEERSPLHDQLRKATARITHELETHSK